MKKLPVDARVAISRLKKFYSKCIYRAICDIVNYKDSNNPKHKEIYDSARVWMYEGVVTEPCDNQQTWQRLKSFDDACSFETACTMLKWNPEWIRVHVKELTREDLERIGRNGLI